MKKIENVGNLPIHLAAFAKELGGKLSSTTSTQFYEMESVSEFEKNAVDIGYEIVPTLDTQTGRGFLVGFDVSEPKIIETLQSYVVLKIYFVECSTEQFNKWNKKIRDHRDLQQADMFQRQETYALNRRMRRALNHRKKGG